MLDEELCPTPGAWTAVAPCGLLAGASDGDAAGGEAAIDDEEDGADAGTSDGLVVGEGAPGASDAALEAEELLDEGLVAEGALACGAILAPELVLACGAVVLPESVLTCGAVMLPESVLGGGAA